MRIYTAPLKVSKEVPMSYFRFERYEKLCGDFTFIPARINFRALEKIKGEKIVYFEIEEPNRFASWNPDFRREEYEWYFYKLLCVCPYTTGWLNKKQGAQRRQFVFFPFDKELIPPPAEKLYDVIYFGAVNSREIWRIVETISKFNYRFIAPSETKEYKIVQNSRAIRKLRRILKIREPKDKLITNKNVTHKEKLRLTSQSKITVVHNLLFYNVRGARQIQKVPDFKDNEAFRLIPPKSLWRSVLHFFLRKEFIIPQQKTRLFEAALCRSLILCRKDPFNIVERFFVPDKEFIYYEDGKLEEKLKEILEHYHEYQDVIENAFQKVSREYTMDKFFEKYLKNLV